MEKIGNIDWKKLEEIIFREKSPEIKECEDKGHPGGESLGICQRGLYGIPRMMCYCPTCGVPYDRPITEEELDKWERFKNTPMTF